MAPQVDVDRSALLLSHRDSRRTGVWVKLSAENVESDVFDAALAAASNEKTQARYASAVPGGFVALVSGYGTGRGLGSWADRVAAQLEAAGISGTLGPPTSDSYPAWLNETMEPTAFITWSQGPARVAEDGREPPFWNVDEETTLAIARTITDFVTPGGPRTMLCQPFVQFPVLREEHLHDLVAATIELNDGQHCGLISIDDATRSARQGGFHRDESYLHFLRGEKTLNERLVDLTAVIVRNAALVDQAFVHMARAGSLGATVYHSYLDMPNPQISSIPTGLGLETRYVLDAHGIQVLTDTHLDHLRNPDNWSIQSLGNERHLVIDLNPGAWFSQSRPDPETLERARADFADLILNSEATSAARSSRT